MISVENICKKVILWHVVSILFLWFMGLYVWSFIIVFGLSIGMLLLCDILLITLLILMIKSKKMEVK